MRRCSSLPVPAVIHPGDNLPAAADHERGRETRERDRREGEGGREIAYGGGGGLGLGV